MVVAIFSHKKFAESDKGVTVAIFSSEYAATNIFSETRRFVTIILLFINNTSPVEFLIPKLTLLINPNRFLFWITVKFFRVSKLFSRAFILLSVLQSFHKY